MSSKYATAALDVAESPTAVKGSWPTLTYYSIGHFFIDLYSNSLGIFAPLMVDHMGISLTQAGLLGGVMSFSSSLTQPLFGYLSDRIRSPLFATLAPAVAGIFISSLPLAQNFAWLAFLVFMGGLGISSFHPAGSARATVGFENRRQLAMAIFISSGTLGLAFGPTFFSYLFDTFGYQTARHVGVDLVKNLMVDARTTGRWYFVVAMGRKAGHLALGIGKAAGATLTLIPEEFPRFKTTLDSLVNTLAGAIIKRLADGHPDGVAVLAEGLAESLPESDLETFGC